MINKVYRAILNSDSALGNDMAKFSNGEISAKQFRKNLNGYRNGHFRDRGKIETDQDRELSREYVTYLDELKRIVPKKVDSSERQDISMYLLASKMQHQALAKSIFLEPHIEKSRKKLRDLVFS